MAHRVRLSAYGMGLWLLGSCGGDGVTVPTERAPAGTVVSVPSSPGPADSVPAAPAPAPSAEATATTSVAPPTDAQARPFFRRLQRAAETGRVEGQLLRLRRWPRSKGFEEELLSLTSGAKVGAAFRLERRTRSGKVSQTVLLAPGKEVRELARLVLHALDGRWTAAPAPAPSGKRLEVTVVAGQERRTVVLPLEGASALVLSLARHTEALVRRLLATGYRTGGATAAPHPPSSPSDKTMRKYIGDARMLADGTIVLMLRSDPKVDGVYTGPMRYTYAPSHPRYAAISKHVGPLEPDGPEVLVRPFPEDDDVEESKP